MKIERIDTTAWEKNVLGHAKENVFVQPWLLQVTDEIFGLETMYLALYPENEHSVHYVVLQKKEHSAWAPFLGYGEIVADGILSEREVYLDIKAMEKDCNIEIQRIKFSPHIVLHDTCLLRKEQASILSLGGRPNQYIENFSKTVRTGIRYAQKHGIQIRLLTKHDLNAFYDVYLETARRVRSDYITPRSLFERLLDSENSYGMGAFSNGILVAGSIFLQNGSSAFFWWNASSEAGRMLQANYLLMDASLRESRMRGVRSIDTASSHTPSIKRTKKQWGAVDTPFFSYEK